MMADKACRFDLMHRVDHCGRGAGPAERETDVGDLGKRGALATKADRDHGSQQALGLQGYKRLVGEPAVGVDRWGVKSGYGADPLSTLGERRRRRGERRQSNANGMRLSHVPHRIFHSDCDDRAAPGLLPQGLCHKTPYKRSARANREFTGRRLGCPPHGDSDGRRTIALGAGRTDQRHY